jgi:hypothetical protein
VAPLVGALVPSYMCLLSDEMAHSARLTPMTDQVAAHAVAGDVASQLLLLDGLITARVIRPTTCVADWP